VLTTGARWEDIPPELGCSGRTAHRRLQAWEEVGVWDRLHADLLRLLRRVDKLDPVTAIIDIVTVRAFGGEATVSGGYAGQRRRGRMSGAVEAVALLHLLVVVRHAGQLLGLSVRVGLDRGDTVLDEQLEDGVLLAEASFASRSRSSAVAKGPYSSGSTQPHTWIR
jgi:hypothetical protein